jgi:hypothetical protein
MTNKEYPRRKDRKPDRAILSLDVGNSLLVIGHSSPADRIQYPMTNKEYPRRKDRKPDRAILSLDIGNSLLGVGDSSLSETRNMRS